MSCPDTTVRDRRVWFWLVVGAIVLFVLNMPKSVSDGTNTAAREAVAPVQGLVSSYSYRVKSAFRAIRGMGGLPEENQRLMEQVVLLQNQVNELESLSIENDELRRHIGFEKRAAYDMIACEVIGRDISGWWQTIRLSKGQRHGIQTNQAVVTAEGLVGRVSSVSARTCDVLLIADPSSHLHAEVQDLKIFGVLSGKGPTLSGDIACKMKLIQKSAELRENMPVHTSGLGGVFPKDVLIGYVTKIELDKSALYQTAEILPAADLSEMNYVFVIVDRPDNVALEDGS